MQRTGLRHLRPMLTAWTVALATLAGRSVRAETIFQASGATSLGYTATTLAPDGTRQIYADVRPALAIEILTPRLAWRAGYLFAGSIALAGTGSGSYSNQLALGLAAELTARSRMSASASIVQGGTAFQLTQATADSGQPALRAPGNPAQITASLDESFAWEPSGTLRLEQGVLASATAPQDALGRAAYTVAAPVGLQWVSARDAFGAQLRPGFSAAQPADAPAWRAVTGSLLGTWSHDFDLRWSGRATAGLEQVIVAGPGHPTSFGPTGSLAASWTEGATTISLAVRHGLAANLQTGTMSVSDEATLRGVVGLDEIQLRQIAASVGYLRARPPADAIPATAAGGGDALRADVGVVWSLWDFLLATARYSAAYQWGGTGRSLVHVALVGLTVRYSNARYMPPLPSLGGRVDRSDAIAFPAAGRQE